MGRTYRNEREQAFAVLARQHGWTPTKRGWPDFACFDADGEVIVVEVKRPMKSRPGTVILRREQARIMGFLQSKGVRCFVSDGTKLVPYQADLHANDGTRYSRLSRFTRPREPGEPTEGEEGSPQDAESKVESEPAF